MYHRIHNYQFKAGVVQFYKYRNIRNAYSTTFSIFLMNALMKIMYSECMGESSLNERADFWVSTFCGQDL